MIACPAGARAAGHPPNDIAAQAGQAVRDAAVHLWLPSASGPEKTGTIEAMKVRQSGDLQHKVIEGTYRVLGEAEHTLAASQDWSTLKLSRNERDVLADAAG